jgi:hypothetical protein
VTPGAGATYLNGDEQQYPTAIFDLDGNERTAVQLRSNALNVLQILLQQMSRYESIPQVRQACVNTFFAVLTRIAQTGSGRSTSFERSSWRLIGRFTANRRLVGPKRIRNGSRRIRWTGSRKSALTVNTFAQ